VWLCVVVDLCEADPSGYAGHWLRLCVPDCRRHWWRSYGHWSSLLLIISYHGLHMSACICLLHWYVLLCIVTWWLPTQTLIMNKRKTLLSFVELVCRAVLWGFSRELSQFLLYACPLHHQWSLMVLAMALTTWSTQKYFAELQMHVHCWCNYWFGRNYAPFLSSTRDWWPVNKACLRRAFLCITKNTFFQSMVFFAFNVTETDCKNASSLFTINAPSVFWA